MSAIEGAAIFVLGGATGAAVMRWGLRHQIKPQNAVWECDFRGCDWNTEETVTDKRGKELLKLHILDEHKFTEVTHNEH